MALGVDLRVNQKGLELIKEFEGFRSKAYLCPAGVWTVGYGHTSAAGEPKVGRMTSVTKAEAEKILRNDLVQFEQAVDAAVRVELNSNQFSALVSFCYNVGAGAFRSSSVLKAVNKKQWNEVPRRLALWNKGGGRVLPGLVRRRAAESTLFMEPVGVAARKLGNEERIESRETPDAPKGKSMAQSTTNVAAGIAGAAGTIGIAADISSGAARTAENAQSLWGVIGAWWPWLLLVLLLGAVGWIVFQRYLKSKDDGV